MIASNYERLAMRTLADQQLILDRLVALGPRAMQLDNAARGLADDCGEVCGCVKKYIEYGQPLDAVNLLEEVGDVLWRLAQICDAAGLTLERAMEANVSKLALRYPDKYTDERALEANRNRKSERFAVQYGQRSNRVINPPPKRTRSEVLLAQGTVVGCCDRHADNQGCTCLDEAVPDGEGSDLFRGKTCETCGEPATRACHDSNRTFTREETHWFCTRHDRPTGILKD